MDLLCTERRVCAVEVRERAVGHGLPRARELALDAQLLPLLELHVHPGLPAPGELPQHAQLRPLLEQPQRVRPGSVYSVVALC